MTDPCEHWAETLEEVPPPRDVCEQCIEDGTQWVHLRQCLVCGRTLCCDDSPMRHTTAHFREVGHAVIRSAEPDEQWAWCYVDDQPFVPSEDGWVAP